MRSLLAWIVLGMSLLAGCAGAKVDEYRNEGPDKSGMSKYGVGLGEVTVSFRKRSF